MKKWIVFLLLLCCLLTACRPSQEPRDLPADDEETGENTTGETTLPDTDADTADQTEPQFLTVMPLPETLEIDQLENCTVAISFEEGDVYLDDEGAAWIRATVYTYDVYDAVDISQLKVGDTIILHGQEVSVQSREEMPYSIVINGGLDNGGFELWTDENGVYYEISYSDLKSWYAIGDVTLPVSENFVFTDDADPEIREVPYELADFMDADSGIGYFFDPNNTTIVIEDGVVTEMFRRYTP